MVLKDVLKTLQTTKITFRKLNLKDTNNGWTILTWTNLLEY